MALLCWLASLPSWTLRPFSQCASSFSAVMKFGAGAGEDPFAQSERYNHGEDQQIAIEGFMRGQPQVLLQLRVDVS